ncbi:NAD(P)/FAD-dependent oxidoreductase [Thermonema rossianum]|uniref:NAD(P)/FAD-dependent oxidoreductase n=1 Tax=Thermonema rossianum TaxID=55505 RepID=UPI0008FFDD14|nr:FAD-dependent monooxygenase [Thermonema rossianum]
MNTFFDVIIVGGGLGGLATGIQLAMNGLQVAVFEKKKYPFHKVCGEYLSLEAYDFLCSLGVTLSAGRFPRIHRLRLTAPSGFAIESPLPLGAIGVSRYYLDAELAQIARRAGVHLMEGKRVLQIEQQAQKVVVHTACGHWQSTVAVLAHGKYPPAGAERKRSEGKAQYVGIKYHVPAGAVLPHTIELHTFKGGYLGSSHVEDGKACLCYLVTQRRLKSNSLAALESAIMKENPQIEKLLSAKGPGKATTISQITLGRRTLWQNRLFAVGDSAGVIAPLCGNGMSMALHASLLLAQALNSFFRGEYSLAEAGLYYEKEWQKLFALRMRAGSLLQPLLSLPALTEIAIRSIGKSRLLPALIRKTHGRAIPAFVPSTQTP